jgi:C1A family cysteine protease
MEYVQQHGQVLETEYPYTSGHGQTGSCLSSKIGNPSVHVSTYTNVQPRSASQLIAAIAKGPVSVTVEADRMAFQGYTGGILNTSACGTNLDHAITAVGYGVQDGQQYYIVRNSWGPTWGDQPYIMIAAVEGTAGICGIQQSSVWPTMK